VLWAHDRALRRDGRERFFIVENDLLLIPAMIKFKIYRCALGIRLGHKKGAFAILQTRRSIRYTRP